MGSEAVCHSCGATGMSVFYEVESIPVHSVLQMPSREAALSYPKRDLRLGFCAKCGFIANVIFDPTLHEYSTRCEETQGFSPTFNRFAQDLARLWIDRYGLHGKRILEIGCGKGEFLVLMCELGANEGVGIDPAYVPERTRSEAASRIRFIQDLYTEKYADVRADFVCCRHTLEHVQRTREFMGIIRRSIGDRTGTIVCFELPDVSRVLKEQAFWDVYYEHCSYFSPGSLARLFRSCGFEILSLEKVYDDQYLIIDAGVGVGRGRRCEGEDDLDELTADVDRFRREIPAKLASWRARLEREKSNGGTTVLWGSGSKAVSFLTTLGVRDEVDYVTDINPHRHDTFIPGSGHRIVPPVFLRECRPDLVIAMNPVYLDEIRADLRTMGLNPTLLAV